jgi:hypothetical protein
MAPVDAPAGPPPMMVASYFVGEETEVAGMTFAKNDEGKS